MGRASVARVLACSVILTIRLAAQEGIPEGPFKTVHFVNLDAAQETKLTRSLGQFNQTLAKAGYPKVQYRLYKVHGKQGGQYSHLWEASWSGRAEYEKIHSLPAYQEASELLKELSPFMDKELYIRFVEIPTKE